MKSECICENTELTEAQKWKALYGTDYVGNLPQYKKDQHVGYIWRPCPYSTQVDVAVTRIMLGLGLSDPLPVRVDHVQGEKNYYMNVESQGSWGFRCDFDGCTHFLNTGERYFFR